MPILLSKNCLVRWNWRVSVNGFPEELLGMSGMRIIFLGTSAGELYPAVWCRCTNCEKARELGGKNARRNSALYIEPYYLIDFPPEIVTQAACCGVSLTEMRHLLITHPHSDHFFPWLLRWRYLEDQKYVENLPLDVDGPRFSRLETMNIYGNPLVCDMVREVVGPERLDKCALKIHSLRAFEEYQVGELSVTPVRANHSSEALNFIIERKETAIFYGLDTGWFLPETYKVIARKRYDLVVLEGTFGFGLVSDGHFNFEKLRKAYDLFRNDGLLKEGAYFVTSHLCPHHTPVHEEVAPILARESILVAYDGMIIDV